MQHNAPGEEYADFECLHRISIPQKAQKVQAVHQQSPTPALNTIREIKLIIISLHTESIVPELGVHPKLGHWIQEEKTGKRPPLQIPESSEIHTTLQLSSHPFQLCFRHTTRN